MALKTKIAAETGRRKATLMRCLKHLLYELAFTIVQYWGRAQQIRAPLLATAEIGAVTTAAVGVVNRAAARDDGRVGGVALLRGKTRDTTTPLRG